MKKLIIIIVGMLVSMSVVHAQSADEYFHSGAQSFIHADVQTAMDLVQEGLNKYPADPKLNALMEKLREEQEQQQDQQQQDQQNQEDQGQEQNQDQQDDQQQQQDQDQSEEQEEQEGQQGDDQEEQNPEELTPEELESMQISKEDAEKILQALAQKEKELLKEFKKQKSDGNTSHEKDW